MLRSACILAGRLHVCKQDSPHPARPNLGIPKKCMQREACSGARSHPPKITPKIHTTATFQRGAPNRPSKTARQASQQPCWQAWQAAQPAQRRAPLCQPFRSCVCQARPQPWEVELGSTIARVPRSVRSCHQLSLRVCGEVESGAKNSGTPAPPCLSPLPPPPLGSA